MGFGRRNRLPHQRSHLLSVVGQAVSPAKRLGKFLVPVPPRAPWPKLCVFSASPRLSRNFPLSHLFSTTLSRGPRRHSPPKTPRLPPRLRVSPETLFRALRSRLPLRAAPGKTTHPPFLRTVLSRVPLLRVFLRVSASPRRRASSSFRSPRQVSVSMNEVHLRSGSASDSLRPLQ